MPSASPKTAAAALPLTTEDEKSLTLAGTLKPGTALETESPSQNDETPGTLTPSGQRSSSPSSDGRWEGEFVPVDDAGLAGASAAAGQGTQGAATPAVPGLCAGGAPAEDEKSPPCDETAQAAAATAPKAASSQQSGRGGRGGNSSRQAANASAAAQHAMYYQAMAGPPLMPAAPCTRSGLTDIQILKGLAASERTFQRLHRSARRVQAQLSAALTPGSPADAVCVELYGSLALYGGCSPASTPTGGGTRRRGRDTWWTDPRHYVRTDSDVDLVILLRQGVKAQDVVDRLIQEGSWDMVSQTSVAKFATTQFTLLGLPDAQSTSGGASGSGRGSQKERQEPLAEVWLDLTCIDYTLPFVRFKRRQEAFRRTFKSVRERCEVSFGPPGLFAFDAYVFLLKAFAAKVSSNALTGFQATCLGLFVLQLGLHELQHCEPSALVFFECFLRFCCAFFNEYPEDHIMYGRSHHRCAIDLSAPQLLHRFCPKWSCEMYFLGAEELHRTKIEDGECMNIAHSIVPSTVCAAAAAALHAKCHLEDGECRWR